MGNTGSVGKCCGLGGSESPKHGLKIQRNGDISTRVDSRNRRKLSKNSSGSSNANSEFSKNSQFSPQSKRRMGREPGDMMVKEEFDLTLDFGASEENNNIYDNVTDLRSRQNVRILKQSNIFEFPWFKIVSSKFYLFIHF